MKKEEIYASILNGTAILITGSGAHLSVKNSFGQPFSSGVNLSKKLYEKCGISDPEDPKDLQDAAETFLERFSPAELVQEIKSELSVGEIKREHKELYSFEWQRVYTTNYDEVPIYATREKGARTKSWTEYT